MGHNDRERRRFILQASVLNPFTQQLFRRAGISSGMNVLDLGCGVGDVSILAARLVGPYGSVTSVDFDNAALETLEARTAEKEFKHPVRAGQCRGMEAAP
jgi:ubiquinone/menaquinone biosynthesis C-methylase UbiE